jgi:hypothetical protein
VHVVEAMRTSIGRSFHEFKYQSDYIIMNCSEIKFYRKGWTGTMTPWRAFLSRCRPLN